MRRLLTEIKEVMGHRSMETAECYIHDYPEDLPLMRAQDDYNCQNLATDAMVVA